MTSRKVIDHVIAAAGDNSMQNVKTTEAAKAGDGVATSIDASMLSVIILLVLIILCAVAGAVYAYLYFTRINPRSLRRRRNMRQPSQRVHDEDHTHENVKTAHTHIFMFRKK